MELRSWDERRDRLRHQLDLLESGKMSTRDEQDGLLVDTTEKSGAERFSMLPSVIGGPGWVLRCHVGRKPRDFNSSASEARSGNILARVILILRRCSRSVDLLELGTINARRHRLGWS
jgi:hypothetical protein